MKTRRFLYIGLVMILIGVWYFAYVVYRNTPITTVKKILILRDDFEANREEIKSYMTDDYFSLQKGEGNGLNSPLCHLSSQKNNDRGEVVCKIEVGGEDGVAQEEVAVFYLKRSGLFPFYYRYLLDSIEVINPTLTATFEDLIPQKEISQEKFNQVFNVGDLRLVFDDYKLSYGAVNQDGEISTDVISYTFSVNELGEKDLGETKMFFQVVSANGAVCTAIQEPVDMVEGSQSTVHLIGHDTECQPEAVLLLGRFNKIYRVSI